MNRKINIVVIIICFFVVTPTVFAEQFTQIGIIDLSRIISNYFRESKAYRELEEMKSEFEANRDRIMEEIQQLEEEKLQMENRDEERQVLQLDNEIFEKKEYLKEYTRIKYNQIKEKQESLLQSSSFLSEILNEIQFIAESEGYSIIFRAKDPNIMWWSPEVDITDMVLDRLRRNTR